MTLLRAIGTLFLAALMSVGPASAQQVDESLRRDAQKIAETTGISYQESIRRAVLQQKLMSLIAYLSKSSNYIDSIIESTKDVFKIRVYVKTEGIATALASPMLHDPDLQAAVRIETMDAGTDRLKQIQQDIVRTLSAARVESVTKIDIRRGKVIVQVRSPAEATDALSALEYGEFIVYERRMAFPRPTADVGGGLSITSPKGCTSGFGAQISGSTRGLLTAAHCAKNSRAGALLSSTLVVSGSSMNIQGSAWSATRDVLWTTPPNSSVYPTNYIFDGSTTLRRITSPQFSTVPNGASVCKYGKVTGFTCQTVVNNAYQYTAPNGEVTGPMVELGNGPSNISQCGDSGGPVFFGSVAYGITSLGDSNGTCLGGPTLVYGEVSAFPFNLTVPIPE